MTSKLKKIVNNEALSQQEAYEAILKIGTGEVNNSQIAAFLFGIQQKEVSVDELLGFRQGMLELAVNVNLDEFSPMDVCGTGGDGKDTFNISTTAAFVVAGAGQSVAKHGNHGVSSAVGSSTVLEHLGVTFTNNEDYLRTKMELANICYLHAPLFHPAMKYVAGIRKELGIKTFFNILGPLLNPAEVKKQLTGVFDLKTFDLYYDLFLKTNAEFGIVHSIGGYDEISLTSDFKVGIRSEIQLVSPESLGFEKLEEAQLHGGNSLEDSAKIVLDILQNKATKAQTAAVVANAGLALSVAGNISLEDGILKAKESIESLSAYNCLKKLVA